MNEYEIMLAGQKLKFWANAIFKFLVVFINIIKEIIKNIIN